MTSIILSYKPEFLTARFKIIYKYFP